MSAVDQPRAAEVQTPADVRPNAPVKTNPVDATHDTGRLDASDASSGGPGISTGDRPADVARRSAAVPWPSDRYGHAFSLLLDFGDAQEDLGGHPDPARSRAFELMAASIPTEYTSEDGATTTIGRSLRLTGSKAMDPLPFQPDPRGRFTLDVASDPSLREAATWGAEGYEDVVTALETDPDYLDSVRKFDEANPGKPRWTPSMRLAVPAATEGNGADARWNDFAKGIATELGRGVNVVFVDAQGGIVSAEDVPPTRDVRNVVDGVGAL